MALANVRHLLELTMKIISSVLKINIGSNILGTMKPKNGIRRKFRKYLMFIDADEDKAPSTYSVLLHHLLTSGPNSTLVATGTSQLTLE